MTSNKKNWSIWSGPDDNGLWMEIADELTEAQAKAGAESRNATAVIFTFKALPKGERP